MIPEIINCPPVFLLNKETFLELIQKPSAVYIQSIKRGLKKRPIPIKSVVISRAKFNPYTVQAKPFIKNSEPPSIRYCASMYIV